MTETLLSVKDLKVRFPVKRRSMLHPRNYLYAVDDVSFEVEEGEALADGERCRPGVIADHVRFGLDPVI